MRTVLLSLLLLAAACSHRMPVPSEEIRPVKVTTAVAATFIEKDFAGMASPDDAVNLAFRISGQLLNVPVSTGEHVRRGAMLAELDPRDVELRIAADRSAFEEAQSQQQRMQRLLAHEAVSRQQAEAADTRLAQARAIYENTLEELNQTRIRAPFDGVVERKFFDTYERVQAGETVLRLVAPTTTTVKFTLPESNLAALTAPTTSFEVRFDNIRGKRFAARLKDFARTSSDASGFPVSLRLLPSDSLHDAVSPGLSCTITMHTADPVRGAVTLPLSAIHTPVGGGTAVWVVDSDNRVTRRTVVTGELYGRDRVIIDSGVVPGERIVTAGVYRLHDGEPVRIIE